ncbi:MAG TPA: hypothetical protein VF088_08555 [Pyrinomonadaceae bacterium]
MFMIVKNKTVSRVCLLGLLISCLWFFSGKKNLASQNSRPEVQNVIAITTTQLPSSQGVVPIALQCQTVDYPKPREAKSLRCVVTNNTATSITAVSLAYSITYEANDQESTDGGFMTLDALVHPDFHDANFSKFIHPGADRVIQRGAPIESNLLVKEIKINIDYVEFENGTSLGPNSRGSTVIAQFREGATQYKQWLLKQYVNRNRSITAIAPLLQDTSSPGAELKLDDGMQVIGAEEYRRNARNILSTRGGASELQRQLANNSSKLPD